MLNIPITNLNKSSEKRKLWNVCEGNLKKIKPEGVNKWRPERIRGMPVTIRSVNFCITVGYPEILTSKYAEIIFCSLLCTSVELGLKIKNEYRLRVLKDVVVEEDIWV